MRDTSDASYALPYHYSRMIETNLDLHHTPFAHRPYVPVGARIKPFEAYLGPIFWCEAWSKPNDANLDDLQVAFQIDDRHVNARGHCHGGMFMTFADATLGIVASVASQAPVLTLSLQSNFLKPGHVGDWVYSEPKLTQKTPSIIFVESILKIDEEPVFNCSSLWKVLGR